MCTQQQWRLAELNARLLTDLANRCCVGTLAFFDPTGGNLSACIGTVSMVEDE